METTPTDPVQADPEQPPAPASSDDLPLDGLRVLELHAIGPVPFAGMVLAQLGARVTRISPPQDPGLGIGLPPQFDLLNRGKTTVALDLKSPADQDVMHSTWRQPTCCWRASVPACWSAWAWRRRCCSRSFRGW